MIYTISRTLDSGFGPGTLTDQRFCERVRSLLQYGRTVWPWWDPEMAPCRVFESVTKYGSSGGDDKSL